MVKAWHAVCASPPALPPWREEENRQGEGGRKGVPHKMSRMSAGRQGKWKAGSREEEEETMPAHCLHAKKCHAKQGMLLHAEPCPKCHACHCPHLQVPPVSQVLKEKEHVCLPHSKKEE